MSSLNAIGLPAAAATAQDGHGMTGLSEVENEVIRLFDQHRSGLLRYVLSLGLPSQDAEEITQEAFLQLFRHLRQGRPRDNLQGWIFRVGHNLALKRQRSRQRTRLYAEVPERCGDLSAGPEASACATERRRRLLLAVAGLSERDRRCLALRAEGLRYREIGQVLGISVGSISNSLTRSVMRLMRVYGE